MTESGHAIDSPAPGAGIPPTGGLVCGLSPSSARQAADTTPSDSGTWFGLRFGRGPIWQMPFHQTLRPPTANRAPPRADGRRRHCSCTRRIGSRPRIVRGAVSVPRRLVCSPWPTGARSARTGRVDRTTPH